MKHSILLWFWMGLMGASYAQTITIYDQETTKPIELVTLMSSKPNAFTTTNVKGQANLSAFKNAEKIEIRSLGYHTEVRSFEEIKTADFELHLIPSSINMEEVVVSASRWSQTSADIPSVVHSISSKEVVLQNPQTSADLLGISGKVFIQKSQQGGGSPMIRGFATNRLLYTVDGVRMNTAIFRGGNIQNVISLDPFATESTEIFFGPGSVIYGSDAIGGVMSFQTLTPQLSLSEKTLITGKVNSRYSTANKEKTAHFDINVGWGKWALVSSVSANDYGNLKMGSHGPDEYLRPFYVQRQDSTDIIVSNPNKKVQRPSAYSQLNMMQKLRFKPNENWDFQYGFHYSETSDYARYDRHIRYKDGLPRYGEWSYGPQKWMMNNLNVTHSGNHALYEQLTLRLAQQAFEESRIDRDIHKTERHTRKEEVTAYSINLDLIRSIGIKNRLYYGLELVNNDVSSTGADEDLSTGIMVNAAPRYPKATWSSYAVYLNDQHRFSDVFLLQAGLRYNQFILDATFDNSFYNLPFTKADFNTGSLTGSLGGVYRPTDRWVISINTATAMRAPNVDDIGKIFDSEAGAVTVPNPDLKPEYAWNIDLGIARQMGESVKLDATGYYTILQNALVRRDFTLNGADSIIYDGTLSQVQAMQNAATAKVYGLQAGIEVKLSSGFGFTSDINFQKGQEELDNGSKSPSRHAAPWFGISRLSYATDGLSLQFYAQYSGKRSYRTMPEEEKGKPEIYAKDRNGNPYSPGWYTLNFKAMYQFTEQLTVSAGMENLMDQRYRPYSSGIVAAGRNFILSLSARF